MKVVQTDFAHGTQLWMRRQTTSATFEFSHMLGAMLIEVYRMQSKGGIQLMVGFAPGPTAVASCADKPPAPPSLLNSQGFAARQQLLAVGVKVREVEVGMAVDQSACSGLGNTLFKGSGNRVNAGLIALLFNRCQGQVKGLFGNQLVLLTHGADRQRQEVQQLGVAAARRAGRWLGCSSSGRTSLATARRTW